MPRSPVVARCALHSMTPLRTASPWLSYDQSEVVLLLVVVVPPEVVVLIGASTIEVVLDELLLVVPSEVVVLIGASTTEVVLDELLLVLPPALPFVLVLVLDEVVPGSGEDEGEDEGVLEAPAATEIVASVADAWRIAPVPPARAQTETARPMAARVVIAARSRDGVGMDRTFLWGLGNKSAAPLRTHDRHKPCSRLRRLRGPSSPQRGGRAPPTLRFTSLS